jgi:hypothetical protein
MTIKLSGKVSNINANLNGTSQVRVDVAVDLGDGDAAGHVAQVIISSADTKVIAAFSLGQSIELLQVLQA